MNSLLNHILINTYYELAGKEELIELGKHDQLMHIITENYKLDQ